MQRVRGGVHLLKAVWNQMDRSPPLLLQQLRGVKMLGSEARVGNIIERKGHMYEVLKVQHTQQGRGGATIQVELRDIQSGLKSSERLRTTEAVEKVFAEERTFTFLYSDEENAYLMEPESYEQVAVPRGLFGNGAMYLTDGLAVALQFVDGEPIKGTVPARVTCIVAEADPYFKGQSKDPMPKKAVLENGQVVMVPPFVVAGEHIIINTVDNSYITRVKG